MMTCYNLSGEPKDDDDMRTVNIPKSEWSCDVATPYIQNDPMSQPLNIRKVNIGTEENRKFANIGAYWDDESMGQITDLLHEFQDLFPTCLSKMKGILGELGEMKILLKPYAKPVR